MGITMASPWKVNAVWQMLLGNEFWAKISLAQYNQSKINEALEALFFHKIRNFGMADG